MKLNVNKLIKKIIVAAFIIYFAVTIYNQQKTLDTYNSNILTAQKEIDEANEKKESLIAMKENANSLEYIEKIAREKLGMYKPEEKVYRDRGASNS